MIWDVIRLKETNVMLPFEQIIGTSLKVAAINNTVKNKYVKLKKDNCNMREKI